MRLTFSDPAAVHTHVWHCVQCRFVKRVRWVDDVTNMYAVLDWQLSKRLNRVIEVQVPARKIEIHESKKLVLIDPHDGLKTDVVQFKATKGLPV